MKRIIWVAQDRRHKIISMWWPNRVAMWSFKEWKETNLQHGYDITKHYIEV